MAAGQGFKTFATGDVLSAADVNGYLMQGVLVFADATERNAEITSPQEGQFAYLKDTNVTTYYTGSAWANLDTTGMTNPMTTTGDTIYSSSGSTPARLGIGSTGQVLTVAGGVPTWASAAASGANWSLVNSGGTALTGAATVTVSGISAADKIMILIDGASSANALATLAVRLNTDTGSNYYVYGTLIDVPGSYAITQFQNFDTVESSIRFAGMPAFTGSGVAGGYVLLSGCNSSGVKVFNLIGGANAAGNGGQQQAQLGGYYNSSSTISSISIFSNSGNLDAGTVFVYTSA
jgi:hypothetical protein